MEKHQFKVGHYLDSNYEEIVIKRLRIDSKYPQIIIFTVLLRGKMMVSKAQIHSDGRKKATVIYRVIQSSDPIYDLHDCFAVL